MDYQLNMYCIQPIFKSRLLLRWLAGGMLVLFSHCTGAQEADITLSIRYPAGSIATVEAAESAHEQAAHENARIELQYVRDEQACSTVFLVNACRDNAKERRRAALKPVRRVQIEADTVMRRMRVAERDKALADRQRKKAEEAAQIAQDTRQQVQENAQKQVRNAEKSRERLLNEQFHAKYAGQRPADHRVRQQRIQMEAAAEAQKRAANVAAYDRKIREAEIHQRDIAARKAEKERKRKTQSPAVPTSVAEEGLPQPLDRTLVKPKS